MHGRALQHHVTLCNVNCTYTYMRRRLLTSAAATRQLVDRLREELTTSCDTPFPPSAGLVAHQSRAIHVPNQSLDRQYTYTYVYISIERIIKNVNVRRKII